MRWAEWRTSPPPPGCRPWNGSVRGKAFRRLTIERFGAEIRFEGEPNRFRKQVVRAIVGTLLEVGRGKLKAGDVAGILAARDRTKAGPTAPAHGLYLVRVAY